MAGLFGTDWLTGDLLGAGVGLLAGATSGGNSSQQSTTLDPRIAQYVYGQDGKGGLLADTQSIYQQQMQNGGLNDMQRQGMGMQYQYLTSPQYSQGAQSMYDMGAQLMSGGVAGNPFTQRGQQGGNGGARGGAQSGGFQFAPTQANIPTYTPTQRPAQSAAQTVSPAERQQQGGGGGFSSGGGSGSTGSGQGISNDVAASALAAMAASENPALRMLSPTIAALFGLGGYGVAGQQADAMGAAGDKLGASQSLANLGIGTVSDADGNVRTYSSPATLAAADAAMFGLNTLGGSRNGSFGGYGGGIGQSGGNASGMGSHQA